MSCADSGVKITGDLHCHRIAGRIGGYPTDPSDSAIGLLEFPIAPCTPVRIRVPPPGLASCVPCASLIPCAGTAPESQGVSRGLIGRARFFVLGDPDPIRAAATPRAPSPRARPAHPLRSAQSRARRVGDSRPDRVAPSARLRRDLAALERVSDRADGSALRARERRWAELLRRILAVAVEVCPPAGDRCGTQRFVIPPPWVSREVGEAHPANGWNRRVAADI